MSGYSYNVSHVFRDVVHRHGSRNALIWSPTSTLTFAELDRLSDRVAHFLRAQGVARGDRVCIRLDKCNFAYAAIVACLKTGAPYFILDPANPAPRAAHILQTCTPMVVFSAKETPLQIASGAVFVVDREDELRILEGIAEGPFDAGYDVAGSDPAYIMFTSGSTGVPKGAVMSHANLTNFIAWARVQFSVTADDVFTNVNPLYFDNSVFDIYGSIFNGAALVPFDTTTMKDPYGVLARIDDLRCTIYFSVPSLLIYFQTLKAITPQVFTSVRNVVFGGEGYPKPKLKELYDCFHHRIRLINVYGPTECTCICSAYEISEDDFKDLDGYPPIGALIANFSWTILNESDEVAALDETGELRLGGPCVGLGYFNEPELTRKAFAQNPVNHHYHERMYRTGDLVRLSRSDGKIHFVGRKDSQIKHQGYRIELGEIEHALSRIRGVDEAAVFHATSNGVSVIIAVVAACGLTAEILRKEVASLVPSYMVPGRIELVERLPKNANGKIDRNLLKTGYC